MEIKIDELPKSRVKFHIVAAKDDVAHFFDMAIDHLKKELKPGKQA